MEPRVHYAKTADGVSIAYAVSGDGPPAVLAFPPSLAHCQLSWTTFSDFYQFRQGGPSSGGCCP